MPAPTSPWPQQGSREVEPPRSQKRRNDLLVIGGCAVRESYLPLVATAYIHWTDPSEELWRRLPQRMQGVALSFSRQPGLMAAIERRANQDSEFRAQIWRLCPASGPMIFSLDLLDDSNAYVPDETLTLARRLWQASLVTRRGHFAHRFGARTAVPVKCESRSRREACSRRPAGNHRRARRTPRRTTRSSARSGDSGSDGPPGEPPPALAGWHPLGVAR